MNICMAGVDHSRADIQQREQFAFTRSTVLNALRQLDGTYPHWGCLLLSTCNRTELWISGRREGDPTPKEVLCLLKKLNFHDYKDCMVERSGRDAVDHLFLLSCGLKSRIYGEDQIVTQVRESLELAREAQKTDASIDRLFHMAITYSKKVKTQINLTKSNPSAGSQVIKLLSQSFDSLLGLNCMVIGNGAMGRLTAKLLEEAGCWVEVTLRQYKHGETVVPAGCRAIPYDDRISSLWKQDAVISATVSPHYTLRYEELADSWDGRKRIFVDMAVPRDIDPEIEKLSGACLYDIDHLGGSDLRVDEEALEQVHSLLQEGISEFENWYHFRNHVNEITEIQDAAAEDIIVRLERIVKGLPVDETVRDGLKDAIGSASKMVIGKMLFGLKESLDREIWEPCFDALEESVLKAPCWDKEGRYPLSKNLKEIKSRI